MSILAVIIPLCNSTSNIALSCVALRDWLSNNGYSIKSNKVDLCPENYRFFKSIDRSYADKWVCRELFKAVGHNEPEYIQLLLQYGADIEVRDHDEDTALLLSAVVGNAECLKILLENGADIEAKNNCEQTAMIKASGNGKTDCLKILLEQKANIEVKTHGGYTALMWAAANGKTECLKLLLQHKANIEAKHWGGCAALQCAAANDQTHCLKLLLQHGYKVDSETRAKRDSTL